MYPLDVAIDYAGQNFDLSDRDARMLLRMDRLKGDFLLKQGGESIALGAELHGGLEDLRAIFAGDIKEPDCRGEKPGNKYLCTGCAIIFLYSPPP